MLPSIFGENLFDDFFTDPFGMMVMPQRHDPLYGKHSKNQFADLLIAADLHVFFL